MTAFNPTALNLAASRLEGFGKPDPFWLNPAEWARAHLEGALPEVYQERILVSLARDRRVSVVGPHGLGKTFTDACAVLWFALTREAKGLDWKVVTTAGAWRQLLRYLWPEIHKWARRLRDPLMKDQLLRTEIKLRYGQAFAVASDEPANIEGAHADEILYIIDEAKNVPPGSWDAIEGALSAGNAYCLANSTPGKAEGRLWEIHSKRSGLEDWTTIHVTLDDAVAAGRIRKDWADARRRQWGANSPVFLNRVLGEFSTVDSDGVIPLDWLEAANDRWTDLNEAGKLGFDPIAAVAADMASEMGIDKSIIGTLRSLVSDSSAPVLYMDQLEVYDQVDTMAVVDRLARKIREAVPAKSKRLRPIAVIDALGVGTGAVDRMRQLDFKVDAFMGSEKPLKSDATGELHFLNRRAEAYWHLRDLLNPAFDHDELLAIPPDDELIGDLTAPKWEEQKGSGRIKIEDKDDIIKRLGHSPDKGDTATMLFNARRTRDNNLQDMKPVSIPQRSKWAS